VINPWSTAGVMMTSYVGGNRHNQVAAADASIRMRGDQYLGLKVGTSFDDADTGSASLASRSQVDVKVERRTERGLQYQATLTHSGRDYAPELGFMPRRNFTTNNYIANWFFFTDKSRIFRRVYPGALAFSTYRNGDRKLESGQYAVWVEWDTKTGGGGWIEPKVFHEDVLAAFPIGKGITIPAGSYDFADLQLALSMGTGAKLRTSGDFRAGTYFDGRRMQAIVTPTWNVSPHLELGTDYQITALRFASRNQSEEIHLVRMRVRAALDARKSGNAFVQFNSTTDQLDFNIRLRYAFAEGTDLWLVYNEGLDTDRARDLIGVRPPLSLGRTMIVKYTHTIGL
jgi:hypothetical protein